ncbi:MAG: acyl-ACP thioesterase [Spirochaetaceae bacterium]|jgi:acyl-ACP thioesterase|nr:acyl-ACP thioesterase [Spirochaetaceae bacterium]
MKDIWIETVSVRFGHVDRSDRLTLFSTVDLFQEAAINHAADLGVGRDDLARTGQLWVLSRMTALMERRPRYGETLTVRSWPLGADRLFAVRDYDIRDAEDKPVARGRSGWLVLDWEKRRPLRVQQVVESLPPNKGINALPGGAGGLNSPPDMAKAGDRRALFSDIDYNGHVNNARYIQWVQDLVEPDVLEKADIMRLDINYLREVVYGEVTSLWTAPIAGPGSWNGIGPGERPAGGENPCDFGLAVEGRQENGQPVFRTELRTWTASYSG